LAITYFYYHTYISDYLPGLPRVRGLEATAINSTTVLAKWNAIPNDNVDGNLIGYQIYLYRKVYVYQSESSLKTTTTSVVLKDLHPGTFYQVYVDGYTVKGTRYSAYVTFGTRE